ncbi:CD209 antigen [Elysia marginata]|uniref:CD209 antigen n=1 Tax=Elysia marginata TaxID=1093978 RepID=A0AAV4HMF7_9GAST|nr:CD209 antigen [Elysia marginata]
MARFPETCQSIVYNADTKSCTPGAVAFRPLEFISTSIPSANSKDVIYIARQPVPPCNTSTGLFTLYEMCGFTLCLHVSSSQVSHSQARTNCNQIGSRLIMTNTMAKLSVFWYVTKEKAITYTWVGLTDVDVEGQFVWVNGDPLSNEQDQYIWLVDQPNNYSPGQDCVHLSRYNAERRRGLNDRSCEELKNYICEP